MRRAGLSEGRRGRSGDGKCDDCGYRPRASNETMTRSSSRLESRRSIGDGRRHAADNAPSSGYDHGDLIAENEQ